MPKLELSKLIPCTLKNEEKPLLVYKKSALRTGGRGIAHVERTENMVLSSVTFKESSAGRRGGGGGVECR